MLPKKNKQFQDTALGSGKLLCAFFIYFFFPPNRKNGRIMTMADRQTNKRLDGQGDGTRYQMQKKKKSLSCPAQSHHSLDGPPHKDHLMAFAVHCGRPCLFHIQSNLSNQPTHTHSLTVTWGWFLDYANQIWCKEQPHSCLARLLTEMEAVHHWDCTI